MILKNPSEEQADLDILVDLKHKKRIAILGSPGAGKTTFAKKLSELTHLPIYHIDDVNWMEQWKMIPPENLNKEIFEIANRSEWIIDGNYSQAAFDIRIARADLIIMLDYSTLTCLYQAIKRAIQQWFGQKELLPEKIKASKKKYRPGFKLSFALFRYIWNFQRDSRPMVLEKLSVCSVPVLIFNNSRDAEKFLANADI